MNSSPWLTESILIFPSRTVIELCVCFEVCTVLWFEVLLEPHPQFTSIYEQKYVFSKRLATLRWKLIWIKCQNTHLRLHHHPITFLSEIYQGKIVTIELTWIELKTSAEMILKSILLCYEKGLITPSAMNPADCYAQDKIHNLAYHFVPKPKYDISSIFSIFFPV